MPEWAILEGDALWWLRELPPDSIDAVIADPPYGIGFMGHAWDRPTLDRLAGERYQLGPEHWARRGRSKPRSKSAFGNASVEAGRYDFSIDGLRAFGQWCEAWGAGALRVLKPGGHLLSFGAPRAHAWLTVGLAEAGFEVRDEIAWLFGNGFPKSRDHGEGRGTALKPAHEPVVLARKPPNGSIAASIAEHGTGALNIEACKIAAGDSAYARNCSGDRGHDGTRAIEDRGATDFRTGGGSASEGGRWPANVIVDVDAAEQLDAQTGELRSGANPTRRGSDKFRSVYGDFAGQRECEPARGADAGGASRFFYCAKATAAERTAGLPPGEENDHPTVKPIDLMRYLVRLVTPPGGVVLDPFAGSGTTGCAAVLEGRAFVGIEREPRYVQLAEWRIPWWAEHPEGLEVVAAIDAARERLRRAQEGQLDLLEASA